MIADLYLRKSNKDERQSVTRQERDLREDLADEGIGVGRVFVDPDLSASIFATKAREDYPRLIAHVQSGLCEMISIWEASRGSRRAAEWMDFLDLCREHRTLIRVESHHRTYDVRQRRDWRTLADDGIDAHDESLRLSERVGDGKRDAARAGKPAGAALFGYLAVYNDRRKVVGRAENPDQAPTVRRVFEMVASGEHSVLAISRETGVQPWHVRKMVRNPGYLGQRVHRGEVVGTANWPALVSQDLWDDANAALDGRRTTRGSELRSLTTGLARCGRDGCTGILVNVGRDQRGKLAYSCKVCRRNTIQAEGLDTLIEAAVLARLSRDDAADLFRPVAGTAELADAEAELARLEQRLQEFRREGRKPDGLSAAAVAEAERGLTPLIEAAAARVRELSTPPALRGLVPAEVVARWSTYSMRRRREIVALIVDLVVDPAIRGVPRFDKRRLGRSRWVGDSRAWAELWADE